MLRDIKWLSQYPTVSDRNETPQGSFFPNLVLWPGHSKLAPNHHHHHHHVPTPLSSLLPLAFGPGACTYPGSLVFSESALRDVPSP